jgi:hypothetical protein
MKIIITIFLACFFELVSYAQTYDSDGVLSSVNSRDSIKDNKNYKNVLQGGIGSALLYFPAYIYYERKLQDHFLGSRFSSFLTLGTGIAAHWEGESAYTSMKFGLLLGQKKAHLETAVGISYFYFGDLKDEVAPFAITIGYRANAPGKRFVFRTGVSWPEAVYVSWGVRF